MQTETINDILERLQSNELLEDGYRKKLCYQLIELAMSENLLYEQAYGLYVLGSINFRQRRYKQSLDYLLKCKECINEDTDPYFRCQLIIRIGELMTKLGNEQRSVDYFSEALNLAHEHNFYGQEGLVYSCMASAYARLSAYEEALEYYRLETECYEQHLNEIPKQKLNRRWYRLYLNRGLSYCYLGQYDQADQVLEQVEYYKKYCDDEYELLYEIFRIRLFSGKNQKEECRQYIQRLFDRASQMPEILDVYDEFLTLFDDFMESGHQTGAYRVISIMEKTAMTVHSDNCQLKYAEVQAIYHQKYGSKQEFATWFEKFLYYERKDEAELTQIKLTNLKEKQLVHSTEYLKKMMQQDMNLLKEKSEHDALTGLANRYYLNEYFEAKCKEAVNSQITLGVIIIDIDHFKKYNDEYGHIEGDHCLIAVAKAMKEAAKDYFLARFGGDEFIIVFLGASNETVLTIAKRIQSKIMECKINHAKDADTQYVTISQGIVNEIPKPGQTITDFIHSADTALYRSKIKARNTICVGSL